jgi:hypothetical protein
MALQGIFAKRSHLRNCITGSRNVSYRKMRTNVMRKTKPSSIYDLGLEEAVLGRFHLIELGEDGTAQSRLLTLSLSPVEAERVLARWRFHAGIAQNAEPLPTASRRYGRLQACATLGCVASAFPRKLRRYATVTDRRYTRRGQLLVERRDACRIIPRNPSL